jgi:hypothetical protein
VSPFRRSNTDGLRSIGENVSLDDRRERLGAELVAALGGAVLLIALLAPIDWFSEESWGGFAGRNSLADRSVTAWEAFGGWLIPAAIAGLAATLHLPARAAGLRIPWELRLLLAFLGLAVLFVATWSELAYTQPGCCDIPYFRPVPQAGFLIGGVGGTLLLFGTLASWPRRYPWEEHRVTRVHLDLD